MRAILIGFMGSGKTTVGRLLAAGLATKHADLDDLIVQRAGRSITTIFAEQGEGYFRQLEHQTLLQALGTPGILSTGGGTPTIAMNAISLKQSAVPVIWLTASDQTTINRVKNDTSRPLVNELDTGTLIALKQRRQALYADAADLTIATDQLTPQQIARQIQQWLNQQPVALQA
ncbi:shikimate kinase [Lactiplantibacillus plantarum]|uniref:shikimate kinase n=1 Tax=Lactiplantibacillus plantarum TaxID=1590 RepID=UPI000437BAFE|nr:shikimate kinase [Lactiplantibacillus plantarum]EYR72082.1 shikimate kinase [Lactiplantibacillus plantarum WHE 92]AMO29814.1 shikimate kinase [Lactiplantibacillus plantarum]AZU39189.1 shikimate kinase [Lactiplantibacillus plantarum]KZU90985.1 Shikimate kinase I [Lactiplantibacillus plantarum]MBO3683200.1 shikimate kinase [Lactiplantibacillus plantarum]